MESNLYRRYIRGMRERVPYVFGVAGQDGKVLACSLATEEGSRRSIHPSGEQFEENGSTYLLVHDASDAPVYVFVDGTGEACPVYASMLAGSIEAMSQMGTAEDDRMVLIREAAFGEIDRSALYERSRQLMIDHHKPRFVVIVHSADLSAERLYDIVYSNLADHQNDFIFTSVHSNVAVVMEASGDSNPVTMEEQIEKKVKSVSHRLQARIQAGIGGVFEDIYDIRTAYQQADTALYACNAFDPVRTVVRYDRMGIAGMIARLPRADLERYLDEMLGNRRWDLSEQEMLFTIRCFFANDLSVTETAKQLYINRNTLIYRLGKFEKNTGYDLRKLDDAMAVKMILMVRNFLDADTDRAESRKA